MATQYPSNRSSRPSGDYARSASSTQPGISRSSSRYGSYNSRSSSAGSSGYGSRSSAQRSAYGQRPSGQRPTGQRPASQRPTGQRPTGQRPQSGGSRRPQPNGRRPQPRRRPKGRFYAIIAAVVVALVALIVIIARPGGHQDNPVAANVTASVTQAPQVDTSGGFDGSDTGDEPAAQTQYASIAEMLGDADAQVEGLSEDQMVRVEGLSINQSLPEEWMNVLLLGTDERTLSSSARTDAMMICSINRNTGEVKLTSIMRDLAVNYTDIGKYNGTYRINAANFFGGPNLAMKTVNELFDMNIQYYVMVNFFGFQKIAQRLGGIEVNVTEAERSIINKDIVDQAHMAYWAGIDESDQENTWLETFGENTHLNGRQTLAYARIRHLDGGDYMRTTRQQTVLNKLMEKAKQLNALQITQLGAEMIDQVKTNMQLNDIVNIAIKVASNGISGMETFRLPVNGTYEEGYRGNESMLWDCDFATNSVRLYNFIYE